MNKTLSYRKDHYKNFLSDVNFKFGIRMQTTNEEVESKDKTSFYSYINNPLFYYNRIPVFKWRKKPIDIDGNNGPTNESYYNFLNDYVSKARISKISDLISAAVNAKYISTFSKVSKNYANPKLLKLEELAISNIVHECIESLIEILDNDKKSSKNKTDSKCVINRNTIKERVIDYVKRHYVTENEKVGIGSMLIERNVFLSPSHADDKPSSRYIKLEELQGYLKNTIAYTCSEVRSYTYVADMVNTNSNGALSRLVSYLAKHDFLSKAIYAGSCFSKDGYKLTERKYDKLESGILLVAKERITYTGKELKEFETEIKRSDLPNYIETYIKVFMIINFMLEDAMNSILGNTLIKTSETLYFVNNEESGTSLVVQDRTSNDIGRYTITLEPRFE